MLFTACYYFFFWIVAAFILSCVNMFRQTGYTNKCLAKLIIAMFILYGLLSLAGPIISIVMFAIDKDQLVVAFAALNMCFGLFQCVATIFGWKNLKRRSQEALSLTAAQATQRQEDAKQEHM